MTNTDIKSNNISFAKRCSEYAFEHDLPFQMVLALKMSPRKIEDAKKNLSKLNNEFRQLKKDVQDYYYHQLHEVGDFRAIQTLRELGLPRYYSRFINEDYVKSIIWKDIKNNGK